MSFVTEAVGGMGPEIVFLHGLGCAGSRDWPPVRDAPALAGRASRWVDLLGFGRSPRGPGLDPRLPAQADALLRLLRGPLVLVGHSMGGTLAVLLAERLILEGRPPLAVVLAEPNLRAEEATVSARVAAMPLEVFVREWPAFLAALDSKWYRAMAEQADAAAYHAAAASLLRESRGLLDRFLALQVPRKGYVLGQNTEGQTRATALHVAEAGIPLEVVPDAGHELSADNPTGFAAAIARLIDAEA